MPRTMLRAWAALAILAALAAAPPALADDDLLPHQRYRLPNGMEIILAPIAGRDMVAVNLWYHVGSGQDPAGRGGLAHVLEHQMFNGSEHVPFPHQYFVVRYGGAGANAYTTFDRTAYYQMMPGYNLETALWLESDRMGFLEAVTDAKDLDRERKVVKSELRLRERMELLDADLHERLFPSSHPYSRPVGGTFDSLDALTPEDLPAFRARWYVPANATLALVGGFEAEEARTLIDRYFGSLPSAPAPTVEEPKAPEIRPGLYRVDEFEANDSGPAVAFGWVVPGAFEEGEAELAVLAWILERRLSWQLEEALDVADAVEVLQVSARGAGSLQIRVDGRPGVTAEALMAEVETILGDLGEAGPRQREIDRAVLRLDTRVIAGLDGLSGLMTRAELLQTYNHYLGEPDRLAWDMNRYRELTPERVKAVQSQWLTADRRVVVVREPMAVAAAEGGAE